MDSANLNNLKPFSIGTVAVNKDPRTDIITVWPQSILPTRDGEVVDQVEQYSAGGTDSFGRSQSASIQTTNTIKAKYLATDPNRMTAPDVRRGAQVQIWRMANTDYYYWSTTTNTNNYQKLETVIHGYSGTKDESAIPDETNTWTQGVDTHGKKVNLISTTKADEEKWKYDVNVNVKEGNVNIMDDIGNLIKLDSANQIIRLQTSAGAYIEINGKDITISCENLTTNASSSIKEETSNRSLSASGGNSIDTPNTSHTGNVGISGGLSSQPGSGGSGMTVNGAINTTQNITSQADVVASGKSLVTHTHTGVHGVTSPPN